MRSRSRSATCSLNPRRRSPALARASRKTGTNSSAREAAIQQVRGHEAGIRRIVGDDQHFGGASGQVDGGTSRITGHELLGGLGPFVVALSPGQGISAATNHALDNARGDYVCFLDHDDLLHPVALESIAKKVEEGYEVVYSDEDKLDGDRFSFARFYSRRARRLFPAMFVTLAATLAAGVIVLSPIHL